MVPYNKVKYHLSEFQNATPKTAQQAFNKVHSSLRGCIERSFGVLKKRFRMLVCMPSYELDTQIDLMILCFCIHNFILRYRVKDNYLEDDYEDPDLPPPIMPERGRDNAPGGMKHLRDAIASEIWRAGRYW